MKDQLVFEKAEIEGSLIARWRRVVEHYPSHPAVTTVDGEHYTYAEFDQASNRLAHALLDALGTENSPIVLLLDHSYPLLVSILGVLKAGKAYVALDTTLAVGPLQLLYEIADAPILVTDQEHYSLAQALVAKANHSMSGRQTIWRLETLPETQANCPDISVSPDANAALLFTSGTVKHPKGVVRSQRMVLYQAWYALGVQPFGPGHRLAGIRHCGTAAGIALLFYALLYGATYCLFDLQHSGLRELADWLQRERITYFKPPIGLFRQWLQMLAPGEFYPHLRYIEPSGRKTSADLEPLWSHVGNDCVIHTYYAATEVFQISGALIDRSTPLPEGVLHVGASLPDQKVIIIKENGRNAPVGEIGEILVRSRYVSGGYWRQPELSADWFTPTDDGSGETIWRTGDFGFWRDDGNLEIVGRQDSQVKLRGYRVVLGEIEDALRSLPGVQDAAVIAHHDEAGGIRLVAYLVATGRQVTTSRLRSALLSVLPEYMIPARFVWLPQLPLLPGGKVDRNALPPPGKARPDLDIPRVAPRSELEAQLADVWADLLGLDEVGVEDNFFELGGESILAMHMILMVEQRFGHAVAPDYFRQPTVAHLAQRLAGAAGLVEAAAPPPLTAVGAAAPGARPAARQPQQRRRHVLRRITWAGIGLRLRRPVENALCRLGYAAGVAWLQQWLVGATRLGLYAPELDLLARMQDALGNWEPLPPERIHDALAGNVLMQQWQRLIQSSPHRLQLPLDSPERPMHILRIAPQAFWRDLWRCIEDDSPEHNNERFTFAGWEHFEQAYRRGQGVILASYHSPGLPFVLPVIRCRLGCEPILTLAQSDVKLKARTVPQYWAQFTAEQLVEFTAERTIMGLQCLRQGGIVHVANERKVSATNSVPCVVAGRQYEIKVGMAELAAATDAAVIPIFSMWRSNGQIHTTLLPALRAEGYTAGQSAPAPSLPDQYAAFLEASWRRAPESLLWGTMQSHLTRPVANSRAAHS